MGIGGYFSQFSQWVRGVGRVYVKEQRWACVQPRCSPRAAGAGTAAGRMDGWTVVPSGRRPELPWPWPSGRAALDNAAAGNASWLVLLPSGRDVGWPGAQAEPSARTRRGAWSRLRRAGGGGVSLGEGPWARAGGRGWDTAGRAGSLVPCPGGSTRRGFPGIFLFVWEPLGKVALDFQKRSESRCLIKEK